MFKQIQNYINFLIVCLAVSNICLTQDGCTDPEAYNCADDIWLDGEDYPNYIFDIGGTPYPNSCNYILNDDLEIINQGGCENDPCYGYYDPDATNDDGSCRYPQAPHGYEVVFNVTSNPGTINVNWSAFTPPTNATLVEYVVQRCVDEGSCAFIEGYNSGDENTETFLSDGWDFEINVEIKYAIAVQYSNNTYWGQAIGASYILPPELGNINGDGTWNVLDIVALANCVLSDACDSMTYSYACDMNEDSFFNVLDIVTLANCVINQNCGD